MGGIIQRRAAVVSAALLLFIFIIFFYNNQQTPIPVTAVRPITVDRPVVVMRTGTVEKTASVPINIEFSGIVSELYVKEGQAVKAGQPLVKVEADSISSGSEASAAAAGQKTGSQSTQRGSYAAVQQEVEHYQKLYDIGAIPRRQLEEAKARLQTLQANPAGAALFPAASALRGPIVIAASTSGSVTGLVIAPGNPVQAGMKLLALGSGQVLEAAIPLEQGDLELVALGSKVQVEVSGQVVTGLIASIVPVAKDSQIVSFLAHIPLADSLAGLLQSGMPVAVRIDTGKSAAIPAVPAAAVFLDEQGHHFVYIAVAGKAVSQQVDIGETYDDLTDILSDLPPDVMVITGSHNRIKPGCAVTVIP